MAASRRIVEDAVAEGRTVYGITTGIGQLANVRIEPANAERVQRDIVRSHAVAVGPALPAPVVRAMLLLRARTFAFGISGVRFELVERLVEMLNAGINPVVPAQGSLGASGDLALLAHLALPLLGEGRAEIDGVVMDAADALKKLGIDALELSFKEGLALVNGTEGMLAMGVLTWLGASRLASSADVIGAMSVEACFATDQVFAAELMTLRKHRGALIVAANLRALLQDSTIVASHRDSEHLVQDAYSLRCIPQVHGAYRDGLSYVHDTLVAELGSAIDNPTVLVESNEVRSGGNFHGESLGLALDHLALCLAGFATISERRTARLVDPNLNNGLPPFLTTEPGLRSGFMIAQYTAASLVSENRGFCWPASSDSVTSSAGQEDHVSMGMTSARRAADVLDNAERVLAIEALTAAQGLDLRGDEPAPGTGAALRALRQLSPRLVEDRSLSKDVELTKELLARGGLVEASSSAVGPLH
jgi:histidine ammonia-lyase